MRFYGRHAGAGNVQLGFLRAPLQHRFNVLQRLGRGALIHAFADKALHVHGRAGDQQHPLGRVNCGLGKCALGVVRIHHFDAGAPALALRGGVQQAGAQHTGDHAVGAGSNNG